MGDSSPAKPAETSDPKPWWPKYSLLLSVFLWLLAWEAMVWFVPAQPRRVIHNPSDNVEERATLYLTGFSPDGKTLVTAVDPDANEPGQIYRLP
jgi:hypothetical protein